MAALAELVLLPAGSGDLPEASGQDLVPSPTIAPETAPVAAVTTGDIYRPLTCHERWHGYLHETFLGTQPALHIFGTALLDHIGHAPTRWGVGFHGYTHRLETRFYSAMIDGSIHYSVAAMLHHDTRYLASHDRPAVGRLGHAIERTIFTYDESGVLCARSECCAGASARRLAQQHPAGRAEALLQPRLVQP